MTVSMNNIDKSKSIKAYIEAYFSKEEKDYLDKYCIIEDDGSVVTKDRGAWLGLLEIPKFLVENDICDVYAFRDMRKTNKSRVACCGFSQTQQKWYGWTHRGIRCFGIGDSYMSSKKAETLEDCKKLAYEAVKALD